MDFSMFRLIINNFFILVFIFLASCSQKSNWYNDYVKLKTDKPVNMFDSSMYTTTPKSNNFNVAVLLPSKGKYGEIGKRIKKSIELGFIEHKDPNITVNFYDLDGDYNEKKTTILTALSTEPSVILGPITSDDVKLVNKFKPTRTPMLSFTSDSRQLGNGTFTMSLIPEENIETIVKEISKDGSYSFVVAIPLSDSVLSSVVEQVSNIYGLELSGLYYYKDNDSESIKETAKKISLYEHRKNTNNKAKNIIAEILAKEKLSDEEKESLEKQLENLKKQETMGDVPYDAILFLGNTLESKNIISFLKYFDVSNRQVHFYGSTKLNSNDVAKEPSMRGMKFTSTPNINVIFDKKYNSITGKKTNIMDAFGYDSAVLSINMLKSNQDIRPFLVNPSGYNGASGLFRLNPTGENERGLKIITTKNGQEITLKDAPKNFITPIYHLKDSYLNKISEIEIEDNYIDIYKHIDVPQRFKEKYRQKNTSIENNKVKNQTVVMPDTEIIKNKNFKSQKDNSVIQKDIDEIEIYE